MSKHIYLFGFLFFCCLTKLSAQKISVGITGGAYLSSATKQIQSTSVTGFDINKFVNGQQLGVKGEYRINEHLSVGTGLSWQVLKFRGTCYCHVCDKFAIPIDLSIKMWDVPLYLKAFILKPENRLVPYITLGVSNQFSKLEELNFGHRLNLNTAAGLLLNLNTKWAITVEGDISIQAKRTVEILTFSEFEERDYPNFNHQTSSLSAGIFRKF